MQLRDFIRESMIDIANGIQDARLATLDLWAVNPNALDGERITEKSFIEFDVAVTVNETSSTQKDGKGAVKAEIQVLGSKIGGEIGGGIAGKSETATQNISRLTFKVPVYMNANYKDNSAAQREAEELGFKKRPAD